MAYIVVQLNGNEVCRRELTGPVTFGRGIDCDVWLNDGGVSRRHARIEPCPDGTWRAVDLGSRNGIYIHQQKVDEYTLGDGDVLKLGPARVKFHAVGFIQARPTAPGDGDGDLSDSSIPVEELFARADDDSDSDARTRITAPAQDSPSNGRRLPTPRPAAPQPVPVAQPKVASPAATAAQAPLGTAAVRREPPKPLPTIRPPKPSVTSPDEIA